MKPSFLRPLTAGMLTAYSLVAQSAAPSQPMVAVHAPSAEALVMRMKLAHPDTIHKIGLHATPPNSSENVIIAADIPSKIGKKSSAKDMELLATGKPNASRIDKDGIYDLLLPVADSKGKEVGFVVMEIPFAQARDQDEALEKGLAIRDEMQKQIPSKERLFQ